MNPILIIDKDMKKYYFLFTVFLGILFSCSKDERGQYPLDNTAPGEIKSPVVENIPGGAIISYVIPDDEDLLYVKAIYKLSNGTVMEQKASSYENKLKIEGMGRSGEQVIQLIAYDRSKNQSSAVEVMIHPLDAPIYDILNSISVRDDFGGINLTWENATEAEVVLMVFKTNQGNILTSAETFYTKAKLGKGNLRGYPSEETIFAIALRDRWGNTTDTVRGTYFPKPEVQLDRLQFRRWNPAGNTIPYMDLASQGWIIEKLWDNTTANPGYSFPLTATLPGSFTFDMGQTAKLSRFKLFHRNSEAQLYTGGNIKKFQVWGSEHPNVTADFNTWVKVGDYTSFKPSGLPLGQSTAEDVAYAAVAGEDFNVDIDVPNVRYLRFVIEETWGGNVSAQIMELKFFGEIKK